MAKKAGRKKLPPNFVHHTKKTIEKISEAHKQKCEDDPNHPMISKSVCFACGQEFQTNMILRWHNEKCFSLKTLWSYVSPKLRGRPWPVQR
jgi:hypothetical protein